MSPAVVVVGDVGPRNGEFHVGDEAMTEALVEELMARGVTVSAIVSAAPTDTTARYFVPSVARLGFDDARTPTRASRELRLAQITRAVQRPETLDDADPALEVIAAIARADALVVAGGGNLASHWPEHIYERSALVSIASQVGKPVVISGQTLGPALTARDRELVAELLARASLVGVRERSSLALARELVPSGVARLTLDDAIWLGGAPATVELPRDYCVVTVAPYAGPLDFALFAEGCAALLDRVIELTDLDIVFLPHLATVGKGAPSGDEVAHAHLARLMASDRVQALPMLNSREAAAIARNASLCISTRYHPVVFAAAAGVPTIGVSVDDYTATKIGGALAHLGLTELHLASTMVASGQAAEVVLAAWGQRAGIRKHVEALVLEARHESRQWWDDAVSVISGGTAVERAQRAVPEASILAPALARSAARMLSWQRAERPADDVGLRRQLGASEAALADAERRILHTELALEAARALAVEVAEPLFERRLGTERIPAPASEIEALLRSRTFRYTAGARHVYGRMRRIAKRVLRPFRR